MSAPAGAEPKAATADAPPPVTISRGPDGRWIVSSPDPRALDRLEELLAQMSAASRVDYQVFQLKYAWATSVAPILKDVFKDEQESSQRRYPYWYDWDYGPQDTTEKPRSRLSKRKPLRIVADSDSNSILVQGGDQAQLRKIEELIKIYDRPQPMDARSVRKTETVKLRYSQAKAVAETVKEVYRDLLSANDKALAAGMQNQPRERFIRFSFDDEGERGQKQPNYKGLLSIGVDEVSNSLILSAPAYLLEDVSKMVKELDEAAKPVAEEVTVVKVGPGLSAAQIEEAMDKVFGDGTTNGSARERKTGQSPDKPGAKKQRGRNRQGQSHDQPHGAEAQMRAPQP
jgi:type II secretory pathway component GspD/PulD (secretin)